MCLSSYHVNIEATPTTYYYFLSDQAILEIKKNNTSPIFFKANMYMYSVKNDKSTCMPRVWKIIDIGVSRTPLITSLETPHL